MTRFTIDHSLLSPSGHMSKRARKAATAREIGRMVTLHPEMADVLACRQPAKDAATRYREKRESLLRSAATLRDLASRGMKPRAYLTQAARLEAEAATMTTGGGR